ncbi:uncharacterized protein LOC136027768 [Artemia franciscana]|uniref:uncharacterized protein LOC136027768 n=1 Tax=Artemia franciscana TaxID=6661 RepID=UPI0032DA0361
MHLINYQIKTRQSTFNASPATGEQQDHNITVSKAKPKNWVSWKETMMQSIPHPPEDMAFKQWRHPKKMFESSQSSQESFNSPQPRDQQDESISKPSTSREETYEGQARSTPKSQTSSSKEPDSKSTNTSSSDTDSESEADKLKDSEGTRPHSATAQAKRAQLKGQKFLKKQ